MVYAEADPSFEDPDKIDWTMGTDEHVSEREGQQAMKSITA